VRDAKVRTLSHGDIHAHNSFENPNALAPVDGRLQAKGSSVVHAFPAASVVLMTLDLA
jgi:alpha-N-arabinofuranosidase